MGTSKTKTAVFFCIVGCLIATIYTTKAGLSWVDIVDHFMNDFNLIAIGLIETIALGWVFGAQKVLDIINENCSLKYGIMWIFCIKYLCPLVFACIIIGYLVENIRHPYGGYPISNLLIAGWGFIAVTLIFSVVMTYFKDAPQIENNENKD